MSEAYVPLPVPPNLPSALGALPGDLVTGLITLLSNTSDILIGYYSQSQPLRVDRKDDRSPVTEADHHAHRMLAEGLAALTPDTPLLSEESAQDEIRDRHGWRMCWLVDPLDGTREFIGRTGEFTINIALILDHVSILGAIAEPMAGRCYLGVPGQGVWLCQGEGFRQTTRAVSCASANDVVRLLASQRHHEARVGALLERLIPSGRTVERVNAGSALKFCALVDGRGDIYPRSSPCYEWDVAAGDALVRAAGGVVFNEEGMPMLYNARPGLLVDYFVAAAPTGLDLLPLLDGVHRLFPSSGGGTPTSKEGAVNG